MEYHSAFLVVPMFVFSASAMSAVTPTITKINVTPTSAPAGTMFKFTAELNTPLPTGYKLKIAPVGLTGFTSMTGTDNSYSLSRAIYKAGKQTYKVVIVNAKNVTQGSAKSSSYTVTSAAPINHAPTLALIKAETSAITNTAYTVTLNAKDVDANLNAITMNWGDNSEPETVTATDSKDLVFSHTYATASSFGWNAFASDNGTPILNSKSISKIVAVSNPIPVIVPVVIPLPVIVPAKTTGYTKIANNGSLLPDSAMLGTNPTDWACTKDNKTGLIWEVKTTDGGLRDMKNTYTWYNPDLSKNGGFSGFKNADGHSELCNGSECDTYAYANTVNNKRMCGADNWRLPKHEELRELIYCSDGKYNIIDKNEDGFICVSNTYISINTSSPTIITTYFPNTTNDDVFDFAFWTSSPSFDYPDDNHVIWGVNFSRGIDDDGFYLKLFNLNVRLVRNAE
ncbi:MAG: DUF1566 domain-containing protein [Methylococcaceae bacterium]